jgi:hypothetical protein
LIRIKKDGSARVLFNTSTGLKLRWSEEEYLKSSTPELIDLKITDYCPYGCSFCYQSSTKKGRHASLSSIKTYLDWLSLSETFEVAIGGGEPAFHPHFEEILFYSLEKGVVPNFTSFGVHWLGLPHLLSAVEATVGGIGVSVHSVQDISKYEKIRAAVKKPQVLAQHVFGTLDFPQTLEIVKSVRHVLLLGYKSVGFGVTQKQVPFTESEVHELLKAGVQVSVDTAFLDLYGEALDSFGIPKILRSSPEGKFSCYIDAVEGKMGPSSYNPAEMKEVSSFEEFSALYQSF